MKKLRPLSVILICSLILCSCNAVPPNSNPSDVSGEPSEISELEGGVVEEFLEEVDNNNVNEARDIYREEINGNPELEEDAQAELITRLENAYSDYNSGTISDTEATVIFNTVSSLNVLKDSDISPIRDSLDQLISSKSAYDAAEAFYNSGDYYNAYQQYMLVIPDDSNYSDAVSQASVAADQYIAAVQTQVDEYRANNDYVSAITSVREALSLMPNNQTFLTAQTTLETEYLQYALDTASATHQDGNNYEGAINIITEAQTVLNDPSLDEALTYYQSFRPVSLFDMDMYYYEETDSWSGNSGVFRTTISPNDSDMYGNTYSTGWRIGSDYCYGGYCEAYYQLNGQYNNLSGIITPSSGFETSVGEDIPNFYATVEIYADDVLIYSTTVYCNSDINNISLDITNVQMLEIRFVANCSDNEFYASFRDVEILMADFTVQKTV